MKRFMYAVGLVFVIISAGFAGTENYAVIIGTYTEKVNADRQLRALEQHFGSKPEMVQLQEANGFDYISKETGNYYIVEIRPITGKEALDKVYSEAKTLFPGLYVSRAGNYIAIDYQESVTEASQPAVKSESENVPVTQPVPKPAPKPAVVETKPKVIESAPPAAATPVQTSAPITETTPPKHVAPPAPKPPRPAPSAASGMDDDLLLYGGAGAAVVLLLVVMVLLRRRKPKEISRMVEEAPEAEAPIEVAEKGAETELTIPVETEEEVIELEHEVAPVIEEAVEEVMEERAEGAVETAAIPEPLEAEKGTPRQKRFYKKGLEPITKESFSLFAGVRILVAEDNLINQKVIAGLLADTGIEIVMANDGKEAVDILEKDQGFEMVLMDAHMPIMDGFEATAAIRKNPIFDQIPVIALSGDTGTDDIRNMMEAGMEGHLEKPLHMDALYEMMYNFCDIELEEEEPEEEIELLPDTPELHAEKGLEISMGDETLYKEILAEFSQMYGNSDEVLHDYMVKDATSDANALLLDVHGLAANIGADRLAETADSLREALMNRDEKRYGELYKEYVSHLKAVLEDIKKV